MKTLKLLGLFSFVIFSVVNISCHSQNISENGINDKFTIRANKINPQTDKFPLGTTFQMTHSSTQPPVIFQYAYESDYVVVANLTERKPVGKVNKKEKNENIYDLEDNVAGFLYSFTVEKTLCSKLSFSTKDNSSLVTMQEFQIFVPMERRLNERYSKGHRYLIFLRALPNLDELMATYELNKSKNYFEVFEGKESIFPSEGGDFHGPPRKGIIDLSSLKYQDLAQKIEDFCSAINESDLETKLEKLRSLTKSTDEDLRINAAYAIEVLQEAKK
jgi:hypothetical protein